VGEGGGAGADNYVGRVVGLRLFMRTYMCTPLILQTNPEFKFHYQHNSDNGKHSTFV
jgi:hypothetical protein